MHPVLKALGFYLVSVSILFSSSFHSQMRASCSLCLCASNGWDTLAEPGAGNPKLCEKLSKASRQVGRGGE